MGVQISIAAVLEEKTLYYIGAPSETRTPDPLIKSSQHSETEANHEELSATKKRLS